MRGSTVQGFRALKASPCGVATPPPPPTPLPPPPPQKTALLFSSLFPSSSLSVAIAHARCSGAQAWGHRSQARQIDFKIVATDDFDIGSCRCCALERRERPHNSVLLLNCTHTSNHTRTHWNHTNTGITLTHWNHTDTGITLTLESHEHGC